MLKVEDNFQLKERLL